MTAALLCLIAFTMAAQAESPSCAGDAVKRAGKLLRLHDESLHPDSEIGDGTRAVPAPPIRALKGKGHFDVLEVTSHIAKATYRMRFIYMRLDGCPLVGQEILEVTGPTG
jgi:hypothetical protein